MQSQGSEMRFYFFLLLKVCCVSDFAASQASDEVMRAPLFVRIMSDTSVMIDLYAANEAYAEHVIHYYVIVVSDDVASKHRPNEFDTEEVSIDYSLLASFVLVFITRSKFVENKSYFMYKDD
jgi:hypothetical protein